MKSVKANVISASSNRRLHSKMKSVKKYKIFYLLCLPGVLYFLIWHYIPMFGLIIAFKDISPYAGFSEIIHSDWVGLKHFKQFFSSHYFWNIMYNTLNISVRSLIFGFPAPIILALLLNEIRNKKFMKVVQTISYLPHFISIVVMASLLQNLLSPDGGLVNVVIEKLGGQAIYFLGSPEYFVDVLVWSGVWQSVGWGTIIYLATITGIDPELYGAATVDGANKFQQLIYITLPSILGVAAILLILNLGKILNTGYEKILLLYSPAVYKVADVIDTYVYREGLLSKNYSYSTAVGLFKSVVGVIMVLTSNAIVKKTGNDGLW